MITLFSVLALGALAYWKAPLWLWTAATAAVLLVAGGVADGFSFWLALAWIAWLGLAALNITQLRLQWITPPILELYRSLLPAMSETEREALEAGTVWWDAELFSGAPDWQRLLDFPKPALTEQELAFLDGPVEQLCAKLDNWRITHELYDLPVEVWDFIKEQRFWGIIIPEQHGGLGFSAQAHSAIIERISTRCGSAAVNVMVPNSLGPAELLLRYGTDAQKAQYLEGLATGKEIPCFALTGPYAGSDAGAMTDYGIVCRGEHNGEQVLGVRLNWEKRYITMGPVATVLGLAFKLFDPDRLLGEREDVGITLALIPTAHPGVEIGRRHYPARQAFQNGPNSGRDVFIPMDWIIGGQERVGQGWRMLMDCLSEGRSISLPALSTGAVKFCARVTGAYARVRKQFRLPIGKLEGVEEPLARLAGEAYALEAARRLTAAAVDQGQKPAVISALLKYQATERMRQCINDAMDVHGGRAVIDGPSNYLFSAYESIPVAITVEGANILTRTMIVFGQGAIRCHPWLHKEMEAAAMEHQVAAVMAFDEALAGHIGYFLSNLARSLFHNLTLGLFSRGPGGPVGRWYGQLDRASASFALLADSALMLMGGAMKRREKLSGRFADALSELYILSCVLKRFEDDGRLAADRVLVDWCMTNGLYRLQQALDGILRNLPSRPAAWALRVALFPLGRRHRPADDQLGHKLAQLLLTPSEARDRLTAGIYLNRDPEDVVGCLEHALELTLAAEPLQRKIADAVRSGELAAAEFEDRIAAAVDAGILSAADAAQLRQAEVAIRRAIDVDDFAAESLNSESGHWSSASAEVA